MNYVQYMALMPGDMMVQTKYGLKEDKAANGKIATFVGRDNNNSTIRVIVDGELHTYSIDHWKLIDTRSKLVQKFKAIINVIREDRSTDWGDRWNG